MVVPLGVLLVLKMYRPYSFCFLVLALAPWTAAEKGNVLAFAKSGDFKFFFSKQENARNEQSELVKVWIQKDNKDFVQLLCNKLEINANTDSVITQLRAVLVTKDEVELESFRVTECNKDTLLDGILVTQTMDERLKKVYKVIFKDDKGGCQQRSYLVEIPPKDEISSVAVTRSKPEEVTDNSKCPIKGKVRGLVTGWFIDSLTHDDSVIEYITEYEFDCHMCWVLCGKAKNGNLFVDLLVGDASVDRIKVSSCSKKSLQKSFKFDFHLQRDNRWKCIYMDYLKSDGTCYSRRYEYDFRATQDRMIDILLIKRSEPKKNKSCVTIKALGMVKTVQHHIGRITNRNIKTKPDE